ncbi:hypothetical protein CHU92_04550 [Flavobacterium cyanobacteriorum]|uniref:DoxX family protein n=1 Tax=Flavobacterium cyanobacteriorum TaxID=2022802 RepID=A0A255ZG77_9FLAO|nr:hypothetical protein [Flavobacterium cyanobacteriorum]OYQ40553.1 hypothetical protein CHU92_04550 [Flavobacterium cyanobacteriorum]
MKNKILNTLLIFTPFIVYLEWGTGNKSFLYEAELLILKKIFINPTAVLHPFIIMPLAGQLLLIFTLFQRYASKRLTVIGMLLIALLVVFIFFIGLLSLNVKILLSTIPFLATAMATVNYYFKNKRQ